jgi:trigger factor
VGNPTVELVGECTKAGFTFKATAPVYPEVTLGQYKGLSAPKDEVKVTAADVDERVKILQDRNTRLVSVDREAKEGDTAVIDFEGFLDGKPFDGGKGTNHSLELGSHSFVPGFEEQVVGMKADEEKDIDITFPEDYTPELAGKAVVFKVKVHEVKEKEVPALDDEFAKDVSEFDTLKDLKADLKKKITEERQKDADRAFEDALMEQVAEGITADVPDAMVEGQARQFLENFKMQIAQQGIPYDQYMKMTGMDEQKLLEDAKEPALRQVRLDLALAAIIKAENIEVSDEEVEAELRRWPTSTAWIGDGEEVPPGRPGQGSGHHPEGRCRGGGQRRGHQAGEEVRQEGRGRRGCREEARPQDRQEGRGRRGRRKEARPQVHQEGR